MDRQGSGTCYVLSECPITREVHFQSLTIGVASATDDLPSILEKRRIQPSYDEIKVQGDNTAVLNRGDHK